MQKPAGSAPQGNKNDFPGFFDDFDSTDDRLTRLTGQSDMSEVTVSEAAKLLGISERSVWRRIRQKKLNTRIEHGRTIVSLCQSDMSVTPPDTSVDVAIDVSPNAAAQADTSDRSLVLIAELAAKLEGATYRNGFLEAQLEAANEQMKLLPDLQTRALESESLRSEIAQLKAELELQKRTRWQRFIGWLTGNT